MARLSIHALLAIFAACAFAASASAGPLLSCRSIARIFIRGTDKSPFSTNDLSIAARHVLQVLADAPEQSLLWEEIKSRSDAAFGKSELNPITADFPFVALIKSSLVFGLVENPWALPGERAPSYRLTQTGRELVRLQRLYELVEPLRSASRTELAIVTDLGQRGHAHESELLQPYRPAMTWVPRGAIRNLVNRKIIEVIVDAGGPVYDLTAQGAAIWTAWSEHPEIRD